MSPRITPKRTPPNPDVDRALAEAARANAALLGASRTSDPYELQHSPTLKRYSDDLGVHVDEPLPPGTKIPSYFADLLLEEESKQRARKGSAILRGRDEGDPANPGLDVELKDARARLEAVRRFAWAREKRDIAGAGSSFLPTGGVPGFVADAFSVAAHGKAPLAAALPSREHPGSLKVSTPRVVSGAAVNAQSSENQTVQETDPTTSLAEVATASIAGQIDLSQQLYDFSQPGSDEWLAAELAADYAQKLESQIVNGTGSGGSTLGLRFAGTGSTTVTKTNGSPTFQTNLAAIGDLVAQTATAYGAQPDDLLLVMSPRRFNWIVSKATFAPRFPVPEENIIVSTAIPLNIGAGTNQDVVLAVVRSEVFLYQRPPQFLVFPEVGSSTLTIRVQAVGYAALLCNRQPAAVGILTGTELVGPVF